MADAAKCRMTKPGTTGWGMRLPMMAFILLAVRLPLSGADTSADTTAKYLAGLMVPAVPAAGPGNENPWIMHSVELDRAWKRTGEQQLPAIAAWAPATMGPVYQQTGPAFYMFSGPDFLYAHAFFPNAGTYVLCGTEPIGAVPDLTNIPPDALPATLANLRKSLESFLNWSFFITREMKTDLTKTQLNGTLPLLYVFLARTGCTIESVALVSLDRAGNVVEKGEPSGVRIVFTAGSSRRVAAETSPQTLYYFSTDLSDDGVKSAPGFLAFCEQQGRGVSLLKAASYLMHENGFLRVRQFLIERSDVIVQDDSGIPLRFFEPRMWLARYCGQYVGPIDMFKKYWQPDLDEAYRHSTRQPLPFGFGYQWRPNRSDLLIAWRNQAVEASNW